jgi:predicted DNA-binding protein (MmcQ/YjbR family)
MCSEFAEVREHTDGFGHVTFQVDGKPFVKITDRSGLCFKSDRINQELLVQQGKYFKTPYIGRHGWVSIREMREEDWIQLAELLLEAYLRAAPKRIVDEWSRNKVEKK